MSDHKNPIEQALDVFVYAPLGLLFSARETIPELAERGRQYVAAARAMGEYAVGQGREQAGQTLSVVGGLAGRRTACPRSSIDIMRTSVGITASLCPAAVSWSITWSDLRLSAPRTPPISW